MGGFGVPIWGAVIAFPILFALLLIPFMFYQYRRYGGFTVWHFIMTFTFVFYFTAAWFMTVLPLPTQATLQHLQAIGAPRYNLNPLAVVNTFVQYNPIMHGGSLKAALLDPSFTQVAFNVLLTVPFGMYLRFYFKRSFRQTLIMTFLLTLFYETTQLSALYGIYWRPYRLFDVDDLILNTTGGVVGYFLAPILGWIFPSRDKMDQEAEDRATLVTWTRRLLSFGIDIIVATVLSMLLSFVLPNWVSDLIAYVAIFLVIPMWRGVTLGQQALRTRYQAPDHLKRRIFVRNTILILGTMYFFPFWLNLFAETGTAPEAQLERIMVFIGLTSLLALVIFGDWVVAIFARHHKMLYEKIAGIETIAVPKVEKG
jgi:glycopeptide antibiotics resistance protein